tara:strand:+ start:2993 stop:3196 length:204 start_codon:yes stop_codon:yes gene_type:complete
MSRNLIYAPSRVWRGVLILWRQPDIIERLKTKPFDDDGHLAKHMPQKDMDCVVAAVNWAQKQEKKEG